MKNIFFVIILAFAVIFAQSDTLDYSADEVEYSVKDSTIFLAGNAHLTYDGVNVTADSVFYFTNTKSMIAVGNPVLIDGTDTLRGEYIAYNIETRSGKVKYGLMLSDDNTTYFGEQIVRNDSAIFANNAFYTTCLFPDRPHSHFYCERIKVIPKDRVIAKPFVLVVGDAPVAALPYFMLPLSNDRTSGWLPIRWGVTLNGRGDVDNVGYYWAINDYLDFMLAGKVDNFENFIAKAQTQYAVKNIISGNIYTDYAINDEYMGQQHRWSLNFNHDQNLTPDKSFTLRGSGQLVSDKKYFSEFSEDTAKLKNQDLSSNLALTKRFDNIGGHASITWNRNQNINRETIEQDLPSVNFSLSNRPLVPLAEGDTTENIFNKLSWSYSYRANRKTLERTKTDSSYYRTHSGMSHSIPITMPLNLFNYIRVTPRFSVSQSAFDSYRDTTGRDTVFYEKLWDTIPLADTVIHKGEEIEIIYKPSEFNPDTVFARVRRRNINSAPDYDTNWTEKRYDTTYFGQPEFDMNKAHNVWWETGIDFATDLYGIFPVNIGRMQGIRHTLTPSVGYTFIPKKDLDVVFQSIGISAPAGTKRRQEVSFSLNNLFETKVLERPNKNENENEKDTTKQNTAPSSKALSFLSAGVSSRYDFEADSLRLKDISVNVSIPLPKVGLSYSGSFHPYDMQNELDKPRPLSHRIDITPQLPTLSGNLWSGDLIIHEGFQEWGYLDNVWENNSRDFDIKITPQYSYTLNRKDVASEFQTNKSYTLGAGLSFMLSERWQINWGGKWSFTENKFIDQVIALSANLECWDLRLDWFPLGVNEGRIYFVAALKKHRDLKWEQRDR